MLLGVFGFEDKSVSCNSILIPVDGSCVDANRNLGYIKGREFIGELSDC